MRRGNVRHSIFQEMNIHRIANCRNVDFTNDTDDNVTLATIIENASFSVKKLIIGSSYLYSRSQTPPEDLGMNLVNFLKSFLQLDLRFTSTFRELVRLQHLTLRMGCYPSSVRDLSDLDLKIEAWENPFSFQKLKSLRIDLFLWHDNTLVDQPMLTNQQSIDIMANAMLKIGGFGCKYELSWDSPYFGTPTEGLAELKSFCREVGDEIKRMINDRKLELGKQQPEASVGWKLVSPEEWI
ncbi:uncharacterized protein L199_001807 [Kwoniella botswanensis]|uniref:uncharacterized protein n=1 Tax=Kwoniella botswanensis TaxID=1268659 RepID=UPI00315DF7ED